MRQRLSEMEAFTNDVRSAGYTHALVLGMGGSFAYTFCDKQTSGQRVPPPGRTRQQQIQQLLASMQINSIQQRPFS